MQYMLCTIAIQLREVRTYGCKLHMKVRPPSIRD